MKEYDVIRALVDLTESVKKGTLGTILLVYPDFPTSYEVEFVDNNGETLEILTVEANKIKKEWKIFQPYCQFQV